MTEREPLSTDPYKGVRDFYPNEWATLSRAFGIIRDRLSLWGYEEYNASPLERAELYESKTSEEIVNEQTYTFTDRGDRRVTLRPEMTPTLARMVAGKRRELVFPLRWFSIPNCFRYERPQRGRLREHYQLNVDLVGLPEGEADIEIVNIASSVLKAFGATPEHFTIRVNSRKLLDAACGAAGLDADAARKYTRLLDKKDKMERAEFDAAVVEITPNDPLSLIEKKDASVKEAFADVSSALNALKERGVTNVVFDPTVTRGFDYYTGLVFEVFDTAKENSRSLFGGGRYDGLVAAFGGDQVPAVGFGMGDVTLMDFLEAHKLLPIASNAPLMYIGTPTPSDIPDAQIFARDLRTRGIRVFMNLTGKSLGDQVKDADRRGIPHFIAYGPEERDSGVIKVKTLANGVVTELPIAEIAAYVAQAAELPA
ncbi:MAG: histidyl-tRNA synthetase [Candidatus Parcubacteria bacterium]|jgi:histidyl-tRNA synthetase|nr:histidyl-tRNA synthetase [Candidatus Parcubacteria bacterium]